jgi:glycosyltransferase involved in cell wall biosynthesis
MKANTSREPASAPCRIAVLLPCHNEEIAIGVTVEAFAKALPGADIYVYDNNSSDGTVVAARAAGAIVRSEPRQGKGHVVRRMFADVDADIYVMADGDATYDAGSAPAMIARLLDEGLDMIVGSRRSTSEEAYRRGHQLGNRLLTGLLAMIFGQSFADILSGYRIFSRRFVKTFPAMSGGFEIETEISVHSLEMRLPVAEVETPYGARSDGSVSKLSTYRDGFRILFTLIELFRSQKPLLFFSIIAGVIVGVATVLFIPIAITYQQTGLVPQFPTAFLIASLMVVAVLCVFCGLILDNVGRGRREAWRLAYLAAR